MKNKKPEIKKIDKNSTDHKKIQDVSETIEKINSTSVIFNFPVFSIVSDNPTYKNSNIFRSESDAWEHLLIDEKDLIMSKKIKDPCFYCKINFLKKELVFFCGGTEWFGFKNVYDLYDFTIMIKKEMRSIIVNKKDIEWMEKAHWNAAKKTLNIE